MKYKVSELEGALLDAAVAKALGHRDLQLKNGEWRSRTDDGELSPIAAFSDDWAVAGPILENEEISVYHQCDWWVAGYRIHAENGRYYSEETGSDSATIEFYGATGASTDSPLVAVFRAFVASKFGEEVDL